MRAEESYDAAAGVFGGWLVVVGGSGEDAHYRQDQWCLVSGGLVIVEERVPGAGVFLDVVRDGKFVQDPVELVGGPAVGAVLRIIAADDGASTVEKRSRIGSPGDSDAVVDAGSGEPKDGAGLGPWPLPVAAMPGMRLK